MRCLFGFFLATLILVPALNAQERKNGFEFNFALVHPARWKMNEYKYSVDPTIEVLYFFSLSEKYLISGGIFVQTGKNNWEELTSHMFWDGMTWRPGRGYYSRQLDYFCMGIPLKLEKKFTNFLFNSVFIGFTGGRYFNFDLTDSMADRVIPIEVEYDKFFWDLQLGFTKYLYQSSGLSIGISPIAGARIHHTNIYNLNEYAWYGLSLSARIL
jgi:hypothetical protein